MAKKKKRRIQAPSLSLLDKGIYYLLIICSIAAAFFLYPVLIGRFRSSVFQDTRILAQQNHSIVVLGFFGFILGGGAVLLLDWLRRKKQPIFGKGNVIYGPPRWKPIYPVFSKQFWRLARKDEKRLLLVLAAVLLTVAVTSAVTVLGLPPRNCLLDDGSVMVYNCFNENTEAYNATDVAQIRIYTREFHKRRGRNDWGIEIKLSMEDGEDFFFSYRDFQTTDDKIRGSITGMYRIKTCFDPSVVILEGKEHIQKVIRDMNLNQQEIELLYLLFDIDDPSNHS